MASFIHTNARKRILLVRGPLQILHMLYWMQVAIPTFVTCWRLPRRSSQQVSMHCGHDNFWPWSIYLNRWWTICNIDPLGVMQNPSFPFSAADKMFRNRLVSSCGRPQQNSIQISPLSKVKKWRLKSGFKVYAAKKLLFVDRESGAHQLGEWIM